MALHTPYLEAIQALPGDTPGEKLRWIARQIKERAATTESLEQIVEQEKFPRALAPLIQIEAARIQNKAIAANKGAKGSQSNYEAIAEALKSEDSAITGRALRIKSFFDGSNKTITNVNYFFEQLFPYVSLNTRLKIIKKLAIHLASRNSSLAEEFFSRIVPTYGMEQALPLLPSCSEAFIYNTIVERKLVLPRKTVKTMFLKNPDLVVRYLRLTKQRDNLDERQPYSPSIHEYADFLGKLVKKRLDAFVELYEMHESCPPTVTLSKASLESFWRHGKEHLVRKPKLYLKILPLRMIDESRMECIFPKLLPEKVKEFSTNDMLKYLENYPEEKRSDLLLHSYQKAYGKSLLDDIENVTPDLMRLLPAEDRVKQARRKIAAKGNDHVSLINYEATWRCYLPTDEAIPEIKKEIATTATMEERAALLCQMVYTCKVNGDNSALLEVLKYWRDRHKNEQSWFTFRVIDCLLKEYDLPKWSEDLWTVLFDIVKRTYVKNELSSSNSTSAEILEVAAHYRLDRNLPIDQVIEMFVHIKTERYAGMWNILMCYPEYERKCLEACIALVAEKYNSEKSAWYEHRTDVLCDILDAIYDFNRRHVKRNSKVEPMSVRSYPWLVKEIENIVANMSDQKAYVIEILKNILSEHEKELSARLWPKLEEEKCADVRTGAALALLRKDPQTILKNWEDYLKECQRNWAYGQTQKFVRATRWYKNIPIKFVEQCVRDITENNCSSSLNLLALLLHGQTFAKFVKPFVPSNKSIDIEHEKAKDNYALTYSVFTSMKLSDPPVPLELVVKLCEGDYLSTALVTLVNCCRRTSLVKVIAFAKTLSGKRVSVRKHGIRIMHMVAPLEDLYQFLLSLWKTEEHYSIREVLFSKITDLFQKDPGLTTWLLLEQIVSNITLKDESMLPRIISLLRAVPDQYVPDCVELVLRKIDSLVEEGMTANKATTHTCSLLRSIDSATCNLLSEEFTQDLLKRFLFHPAAQIAESARTFLVASYLRSRDKLEKRLQVLSEIFVEAVKTGWDVPHPENPRFFPVNYAIHRLVEDVTQEYAVSDLDPRIGEALLRAYEKVLTPQMDAASYLLLVYGIEHAKVKTAREYGVNIGEMLSRLIEVFSPYLLSFMCSILEFYIAPHKFEGHDDKTDVALSIIEGLIEVGTVDSLFVSAKLLPLAASKEHADRYDPIVKKLAKCDHPAVKSIVYDFINKVDM